MWLRGLISRGWLLLSSLALAASVGCAPAAPSGTIGISDPSVPPSTVGISETTAPVSTVGTSDPTVPSTQGFDGHTGYDSSETVTLFWPEAAQVGAVLEPPLIVLVPGGAWVAADPGGLVPLANTLVEAGAVVATLSYRTASEEAFFPVPVEDVACGISYAKAAAANAGYPTREVVVVGHSTGAHLSALVALLPESFSGDCAYAPIAPDRMVGLSGLYDVTSAARVAVDLFGPDRTDRADWSAGNPLDHASERPDVPILLIHGKSDSVVPMRFSEQFAAALVAGGHPVEAIYPDEVDHHSVYSHQLAAPLILPWLGLEADVP